MLENSLTYYLEYALTALLMFAFAVIYLRVAKRFRIVDNPSDRSSHSNETITGGGLIFFLAVVLYFIFNQKFLPFFFAGLSLLAVVSYADDVRYIGVFPRFVVQFVAALLLLCQIGMDWNVDFEQFLLSNGTCLLVMLVAVVGIFNLFNFMDGINGMLGITSFILFLTLLVINRFVPGAAVIDNDYLYYVLIALALFLFFNFRKKARYFAGDVGAICLSFIAAYAVALLIIRTHNFVYIFLFAPYAIEAGYTIVHRIYRRENIFKPHRIHLFQLLCNELSLSHTRISTIYGLCQLIINAVLVWVIFADISRLGQWLIVGSIYAVLSLIYIYWKYKIMNKFLLVKHQKNQNL